MPHTASVRDDIISDQIEYSLIQYSFNCPSECSPSLAIDCWRGKEAEESCRGDLHRAIDTARAALMNLLMRTHASGKRHRLVDCDFDCDADQSAINLSIFS